MVATDPEALSQMRLTGDERQDDVATTSYLREKEMFAIRIPARSGNIIIRSQRHLFYLSLSLSLSSV